MKRYLTPDEVIHKISSEKLTAEAVATGFKNLDLDLDGGFYRKELIVLGAFTGVGKSQIAGQLMLNAAKQGFKCAYFSLEITNEMIVARLVGASAGIKPTRIRFSDLSKGEHDKKIRAEAEIQALGELDRKSVV